MALKTKLMPGFGSGRAELGLHPLPSFSAIPPLLRNASPHPYLPFHNLALCTEFQAVVGWLLINTSPEWACAEPALVPGLC